MKFWEISHFSRNGTAPACVIFSAMWSIVAVLLIFFYPAYFDLLSYKFYDLKLSLSPVGALAPEIVHLDIDDPAIGEYGQWPWDRALSARIVDRLSEFGAKLVVFDIFYASPGKSKEGDAAFFEAIKRAGNVISPTVAALSEADSREKLRIEGDRSRADDLYDVSWPLQVPSSFSLPRVTELKASLLPLQQIIQSSRGIGHITATPDSDGVYRRCALLVRLEDRCIPSLSLSALLALWNLNPNALKLVGGKQIKIKKGAEEVSIPVDRRGMMLINWGKPWDSFKHYPVNDVLSDAPDSSRSSRYKGKIVMVALATTGNTDIWSAPVSTGVPGNQIQSFAINTILTQTFIKHVSIFPWIALFFAFLAIIFPLATEKPGLKAEAGLLLLISLICISLETLFFVLRTTDVALVGTLVVFLPAALGSFVIRSVSLERQAAASRRALERYLAPELLDEAVHGTQGPDLSGRRLELTIVFVDMQAFSTLSEAVDAEYVSRFLKNFFEKMSGAIIDHRGRIHQFLGDGFLAVFGDLIPLPDHAHEAVEAAIEMQKRMAEINAMWSNSGIKEFENGLNIRIGINTGIVFVGNLGSDRRLEYTVVGSAVNIASRVQSLAPPGGIMMTSRTKALWRDPGFCKGPQSVRLKGIDRETEVYTIEKVV